MKYILFILLSGFVISNGFSQSELPTSQDSLIRLLENINRSYNEENSFAKLDSNERYKNIREGIAVQDGQLKIIRNGFVFPLNKPITLKNGSIVFPDGIIRMTNGTTPLLSEDDYIDMSGNIRSLAAERNRTAFWINL
jgi:hypothetical protein